MDMPTLYFHAECAACSFESRKFDNIKDGGVLAAQRAAKAHLKKCKGLVNIFRDGALHSTAQRFSR